MKRKNLVLALVAALAATPAFATNDETVLWKQGDIWSVRVDRTLNYGCYISGVGTRGTLIRLGYNKTAGGSYLMLGHESWQSIEDGKLYPLTIQFDSEPAWTGSAYGKWLANFPGIYVTFNDGRLAVEFAVRHIMAIWMGQKPITRISLKGSSAAFNEIIECQKYIDANRSAPVAPTAPPPTRSRPSQGQPISDPFR